MPVTVFQHSAGSGLSAVATAATAGDGSFQVSSSALTVNTVFYARAAGARPARAVVKVAPQITLAESAQPAQTSAIGAHAHQRPKITFTGAVSPTAPGARVALQIAYATAGEHWRAVAFGQVGADGTYSITHSFRAPGALSVRAVVHPAGHNTAGISEAIVYEVAQPQNPKLTIAASQDPVTYGAHVTISGVAGDALEKPVTLLARSAGGVFTTVASGTTDATGHYAFEQEPLQNTSYKVVALGQQSTPLFEGVLFTLTPAAIPAAAQPGGGQVTFEGTLAPAAPGQVVYLEREYASGAAFHVIATGAVAADSHYAIAYTFARPGTAVVRIKVPGNGKNLTSTTEPSTITVVE